MLCPGTCLLPLSLILLATPLKIIKCSLEWTRACIGLELFYSQSDQDSFRLLTMIRTSTKISAHNVMRTPTTIVVVMRDGGLTRFGSCPSGGTPAGKAQRSIPGGISEEAIVIGDHGEIKAHRDVRRFKRPDATSHKISWSGKCLELYHPRRVLILLWGQTDSGQQQCLSPHSSQSG